MKLLDIVKSSLDKTVKFIFTLEDGIIMEMAYIDNNTGKDIICVSTQSSCAMGCKMCHTTDYIGKLKVRNLTAQEIIGGVRLVCNDINLHQNNRMLLISYMGCGEPLLNVDGVIGSMIELRKQFTQIRFAIATMLPKSHWNSFFTLTKNIYDGKLPVKIHLSLHSPIDAVRAEWLPNALEIAPSIAALSFYRAITGNAVEIHYTIIDGVNNREVDIAALCRLLSEAKIPVKFLKFNEKTTLDAKSAVLPEKVIKYFELLGIQYEFYTPPGADIGSSCGAFDMSIYLEYNSTTGSYNV